MSDLTRTEIKPQPIKFTIEQGGTWFKWDGPDPAGTQRRHVHAVLFEDGSVFDATIGWRKITYCPCCGARKPDAD